MLSKKNYQEKLRKMEPQKERYSIRKFTIGAASVLIGLTFFGISNSESVKADTINQGTREAIKENDKSVTDQVNKSNHTPNTYSFRSSNNVDKSNTIEITTPKINATTNSAKSVDKKEASESANSDAINENKNNISKDSTDTTTLDVKNNITKPANKQANMTTKTKVLAEATNEVHVKDATEFQNALSNTQVDQIVLDNNITNSNKNYQLATNSSTGRNLIISGSKADTVLDLGSNAFNLNDNPINFKLTFKDLTINSNNNNGIVTFSENNGSGANVSFQNVKANGSGTLINASGANVTVDNTTAKADNNQNIVANNVTIGDNTTLTSQSTNGNITASGDAIFAGKNINLVDTTSALAANINAGGTVKAQESSQVNLSAITSSGLNVANITANKLEINKLADVKINSTTTATNNGTPSVYSTNFDTNGSNAIALTHGGAQIDGNLTINLNAPANSSGVTAAIAVKGNTNDAADVIVGSTGNLIVNAETSRDSRGVVFTGSDGGSYASNHNFGVLTGGKATFNMGHGVSNALWNPDNLVLKDSSSLVINTLQDSNGNTNNGIQSDGAGVHSGPITMGFWPNTSQNDNSTLVSAGTHATIDVNKGATLRIIRSMDKDSKEVGSPLITYGGNGYNSWPMTINVNGGIFDLEDAMQYRSYNGIIDSDQGYLYNNNSADQYVIYPLGMIDMYGVGTTDRINIVDPQLFKMVRTGKQQGMLFRLEGSNNQISWKSTTGKAIPIKYSTLANVAYNDGTISKAASYKWNILNAASSNVQGNGSMNYYNSVNWSPSFGNSQLTINSNNTPATVTFAPETSQEDQNNFKQFFNYWSATNLEAGTDVIDANKYDPKGKPVSTPEGTVPKAEKGIKNTTDLPEGTKYTWKKIPDVTKPGKVPATVVVTYPDGSKDEVPTTVTVDAKPIVKTIQTTVSAKPEATKGIANLNNGGTKPVDGYPSSVTWTKAPDTSKVGPTTGTATVTYPDGTSQTVTIPVAVNDPTHVTIIDDKGHSYSLSVEDVYSHKTEDKNIIGSPVVKNFSLSYYEGGQNYSKPFIYTLEGNVYKLTQVGDLPTTDNAGKAAAYPQEVSADEISAVWAAKGTNWGIPGVGGNGAPTSVASDKNGGTATIKYTGQLNTQGTDYVYPMYAVTIDSSKVNWPIFGFGPSDSHAFPSVFIYGAKANGTIPSVNQNTKDLEKVLGDASKLVDENDLTKENNSAVKSTTWQTLPSLDKANAKTPATVRINFEDGTHLDIPVNVNVIGVDNGNTDKKNHDVYRDITRTITVEGEKEPVVQHVIYSRVKTTNLAKPEGQQVSYTDWVAAVDKSGKAVTNFPEFNVTKPGYTATATGATIETKDGNQYVPATATITPDSKNEVVNVTYTANDHTLVITYVDKDTGKQVGKAYDVTGKTGEEVKVDVASHVPTDWTLVPGQEVISTEKFGSSDPAAVSYKVEHKTENVPVNKNDKDTYREITQIITEVKDGKDSQLSKIVLPFQRTGVKDLVTGKITWNAWEGPEGSKDVNGVSTYTVPAYTKLSQPGYVVSSITINGTKSNDIPAWNVTGDSTDQNVVVTYEAAEHKQVINFVNNADPSQVVGTYEVPGKTGETVTVDVAGHVPTNWRLVPGQQVASSITFGTDNPATLTYKVEHKTENVPVNKNDKNTYREITQTIISIDPVTNKKTTVDTTKVLFQRTGVKDLVTGKITWNAWQGPEGTKDGVYTVPAQQVNQKPGYDSYVNGKKTTEVPAWSVTADSENQTDTITYVKQGSTPVPYVPGKKGVNDEMNKYVTRTIIVKEPGKPEVREEQTVHFTNEDKDGYVGYKDPATGKITYNTNWHVAGNLNETEGTWNEYTAPTVKGYTANPAKVAKENVSVTTKNTSVTINYTKNGSTPVPYVPGKKGVNDEMNKYVTRTIIVKEPGKPEVREEQTVHFTNEDKDGYVGYKDPATGKITYNTNWHVAGNLDETEGTWNEYTAPTVKGYTANPAKVAKENVSVTTKNTSVTINYTKDSNIPVPYVPGKKGVNDEMNKYVTRTIIVKEPGKPEVREEQTVHFTNEDKDGYVGYKDPTTGKITYNTNWHVAGNLDETEGTWNEYTAPAVKGYTAKPASVAAETVTYNTPNTTTTINYIPAGSTPIKFNSDNKDMYREVVRTIVANVPNTEAKTEYQKVAFSREDEDGNAGYKTADGKIIMNDWHVVGSQNSTGTWAKYTAPVVSGYVASPETVAAKTVTADTNNTTVQISYKQTDASKYTPTGGTITVEKGTKLTDTEAENGITNKNTLPEGTKYTWKTPVDTSTVGNKIGIVTVHYPDQTSEDVPVMVHVVDQASQYNPEGNPITIKKGNPIPEASKGISNKDTLPKNTKYTWEVAPDPEKVGQQPVIVKVTYPDGSSTNVPTTVTVIGNNTPTKKTDADKYDPQGQVVTVNKGAKLPEASKGISNKDTLPEGTKYTWKNPVDTSTAGDKPAVITVTYPDGSSEDVPTIVRVKDTDADKYTPEGQNIQVKKGAKVPEASKGISNKDTLPEGTKYTWEKTPDTNVIGDQPAVVVVTYPDGSQDKVPVIITVKDSTTKHVNTDADQNDPIGGTITVKLGTNVSNMAEQGIVNRESLKDVESYTWTDGTPSTDKTGLTLHDVTVTYKDGSKDIVPVYVNVISDANKYTPIPQVITTPQGKVPVPSNGIKNKDELPKNTKYTWEKTPDTTKPGNVPAVIIVTYPDGSKDRVPTVIHVNTPATDAEKYKPEGQDVHTTPGNVPNPVNGIKNKDDMPEGTKYTWEKTPDVTKPGTKTGVIVVTYPDGSKDKVEVKVIVEKTKTDADKYKPEGQDVHTTPGNVPNPVNGIKNRNDMPEGTKYIWKEAPDVTTIGEHTGVITVEFPDGSSVDVKVKVYVDAPKSTVKEETNTTKTTTEPMKKVEAEGTVKAASTTAKKTTEGKKTLPQTGAKSEDKVGIIGLAIAAVGSLFGLGVNRRKNEDK